MTYLAHITFKVKERILWIPFSVYREGTLFVEADSDKEAAEKMAKYASTTDTVYTWTICKSL